MAYKIPKIFSEKDYVKLAKKEGVDNPILFAKFMKERFPEERHISYVLEWVGRFKTGSPQGYMDSHSLSIYQKLWKVV
jgi:hypothetical protein